jgi:diguanylate cyclase
MLPVLNSLFFDHDLRIVLIAAVICVFGTVSTMNVSSRVAGTRRAWLWLLLVSICAGATVWATHFIAMLAYMKDLPTTYAPGLTALSFGFGAGIMGLGFGLAIMSRRDRTRSAIGGAVVGIGVVVLHYTGMAAMQVPGHLTYAPGLVVTSIVFSIGFGMLAMVAEFGPVRRHARVGGVSLTVLMIVTLHFTAIGAVHIGNGVTGAGVTDGVTRSVLVTAIAIASLSVLLIGMMTALLDRKMSQRLAAEADRFRTLADGAFEGLVVHRGGKIVDANAAARRLFGLPENPTGQSIQDWFENSPGEQTRMWAVSVDGDTAEFTLRRPDGSTFPAEICRRSILLSDGMAGELFAIRDLTARKESEARIAHLALHDPLTDLPNRRFFLELAQKTISLSHRNGDGFALFTLDFDDFKLVNDMHGHLAGDELLRIAAQRITTTLRDADVAARFGGDEFAVLANCPTGPKGTAVLAERLLEALQAPVRIGGAEVAVSVSIGIALFPNDGATVEDLLRNSDTAMYRAKSDGKATFRFFEPHMDAALVARRRLENGLRRAVADERLTVMYQPIVDSESRTPVAFEALVRWNDPELGMVPPSAFIPVAEEAGLIIQIGEFVIRRACMDAMKWSTPLRVAVNLSAVQFKRKGLLELVRNALADTGLPGDRLELEVTETLLLENRDDALRQLNQLKALGVRISMDDFGTGYSSLSYLQCFPFDTIKIDRAFVSDLPSNMQNASIVRAVAALGRSLHMRVVAEGVETNMQAEMLKGLECDELQGYLIARPMNSVDVEGFLAGCALPRHLMAS